MSTRTINIRILPSTSRNLLGGAENTSSVCRAAVLAATLVDSRAPLIPLDEMQGASPTTVSLDPGTAALLWPLKDRGYKSLTVVLASVTFDPALRGMLASVLSLGAEARTELLRETLTTLGLPTDMLPPSTQAALPKRPVGRPRSPARQERALRDTETALLRLLLKHRECVTDGALSVLEAELSEVRRKIAAISNGV